MEVGLKPGHPLAPGRRRLVVTGHPNHELAIFGFVQRLRPRLLFLTDGGGPRRMAESRQALAAVGSLEDARFVGCPEASLYQALLARDRSIFDRLVAEVRSEITRHAPEQVLCEGIELYNPLHDMTLPIVRAAIDGHRDIELLEFPLIAQIRGCAARYRVQRLSPERAREAITLRLSPPELAHKLAARDQSYPSLREQLATVLAQLEDDHAAVEVFAPARPGWAPPHDCVFRYEARGRSLQAERRVERVITYDGHFHWLASELAGPSSSGPST
jgi:hypothetical protein